MKMQEELARLANPRKGIIDEYRSKIVSFDEEIATARQECDDALARERPLSSQKQKELIKRRDDLIAKRGQIAAKILRLSRS